MALMTLDELTRYTGEIFSQEEGGAWLAAGQQAIEAFTGRKLCHASYCQQFALGEGAGAVLLNAYPIDETQAIEAALNGEPIGDYTILSNGLLLLGPGKPAGILEVRYAGGYREDAMPEPIKIACALTITALRTAQESGGRQVTSEKLDGYAVSYAQQAAGQGLANLSPAAAALLAPYIARGW